MAAIVVPFRGSESKRRLEPLSDGARAALALAMLGDVVEAAIAVGETVVVTEDAEAAALAAGLGADVLEDPGGGQGAAVAAALARLDTRPVLVVNADLACAQPRDLLTLLGAIPDGGLAVVPAADGTTNALGLAAPQLFEPLYGPESARRFRWHAEKAGLAASVAQIPNLIEDVDTLADLERLEPMLGPRTRATLAELAAAVGQ